MHLGSLVLVSITPFTSKSFSVHVWLGRSPDFRKENVESEQAPPIIVVLYLSWSFGHLEDELHCFTLRESPSASCLSVANEF